MAIVGFRPRRSVRTSSVANSGRLGHDGGEELLHHLGTPQQLDAGRAAVGRRLAHEGPGGELVTERGVAGGGGAGSVHLVDPGPQLEDVDLPLGRGPHPGQPEARVPGPAVADLSAAMSAARGPDPLYGRPEPLERQLQTARPRPDRRGGPGTRSRRPRPRRRAARCGRPATPGRRPLPRCRGRRGPRRPRLRWSPAAPGRPPGPGSPRHRGGGRRRGRSRCSGSAGPSGRSGRPPRWPAGKVPRSSRSGG